MESDARGVVPADLADILESTALAHVATVGPGGAPQVNPVWFVWDGAYLRFSQTTARQTYRNVRRDSRVVVSIADPSNPYRYLELRGAVVRIDPDPDLAFVDQVARTYLGPDRARDPAGNPLGEERVVVVVEPSRVTRMGSSRRRAGEAQAQPGVSGAGMGDRGYADRPAIELAALAKVGLRTDREQAWRLTAALATTAAVVRVELGPDPPPTRWASLSVYRMLGSMSRCELGDLVAGLGLADVSFAAADPGDPADPARAVLDHLLRDRLIDALRVAAGLGPFWCWPAADRHAGLA